jgi:D-glycero-D-manno-heptose 1,7-bisphosphate phosphatase
VSAPAIRRAVILDRDGTIVVDRGYLDDPTQLCLLPGAAQGLRSLHERGHQIIVVSNQSGVGRGRLTLTRMHEINALLTRMVEAAGAKLDGIYCCPHRPEDDCACRKPKTKLVLDAAAALGFDPNDCVVIGDKSSDIELGRRLQATTMLISENGRASDGTWIEADFVIRDLAEAARVIEALGSRRQHSGSIGPSG